MQIILCVSCHIKTVKHHKIQTNKNQEVKMCLSYLDGNMWIDSKAYCILMECALTAGVI